MSKSVLNAKPFHDEAAAYAFVEERVWPEGPVCPHCGATKDRVGKLAGKSTRIGVYKCYACRKPFTVKVGTIFEASHVALHLWLQAMFLICSSKKGVSANQLHRTLGVTLKTAWFMAHRIREAKKDDGSSGPLGGEGEVIEADETFLDKQGYQLTPGGWQQNRGDGDMKKIFTLVERDGRARSIKVDDIKAKTLQPLLLAHAHPESALMTDEAKHYRRPGQQFASHEAVDHSKKEYGRGRVHTNTVEGFFSIFKRGMKGIYQHCGEQHLQRYLVEFDFRYSNRIALGVDDVERTSRAVRGIVGKRLTYRTTSQRT